MDQRKVALRAGQWVEKKETLLVETMVSKKVDERVWKKENATVSLMVVWLDF